MEYQEKPYNNAHKQWINVTGGHTISPNGSIRLRRRGLPHPDHYPICDQEDETARHIPSFCVFARQFRVSILQPSTCLVWCLLDELTPFQIGGESPGGKCQNIIGRVTLLSYLEHGSSGSTEALACLMDLLRVFTIQTALQAFKDKSYLWLVGGGGAKGLAGLGLGKVT